MAKTRRYRAVLVVGGDATEQKLALRRAIKLLLRACGVRVVELTPEVPRR